MSDKAKQSASSFLKSAKTSIARGKQQVLVKMGKSEETVDLQFNQERDRFVAHKKAVKKLKNDAAKFMELLRELQHQQATLAQDFYEMYDTQSALYGAVSKNQDIAKSCEQHRIIFDEQMKTDMLDPLSKYLGQFKEIKNRIELRHTRRVDMDRYSHDHKSAQEQGKSNKANTNESKYENAKLNYSSLNEELLRDLPVLYEDRIPFFDPAFATFVTGLAEYYREVANTTAQMVPTVQLVNRSAIHNHPPVITPAERSSATHTSQAVISTTTTTTTTTTGNRNTVSLAGPGAYGQPAQPQQPDYYQQQTYQQTTTSYPSAPVSAAPAGRSLPTAPVRAPAAGTRRARALFDFNAQEANELSFRVGDVITIHTMNGDWWDGELHGRKGLLPSNYVQLE